MPQCIRCRKKGWFLIVSPKGFCEDCVALNRAERREAENKRAAQALAESAAIEKAKKDDLERKAAARRDHLCSICGQKAESYYMNDWCYECTLARIDQNDENVSELLLPSTIDGLPVAYKYDHVRIFTATCLDDPASSPIFARQVRFVREPENEYDKNAIAIYTLAGLKVGYIYRGTIQDMINDYIAQCRPIFGCITTIDDDTSDVKMTIIFYKSKHTGSEKTFSLTGSAKSGAQDTLMCVSENDDVDIEYDYDKEKYYADCGGFIGFFPASANDIIENRKNAFVSEIEMDDNLKYKVKITVSY